MRTQKLFIAVVLAATTAACATDSGAEEPTFDAVMKKVIEPRCTFGSCHAVPTKAASLDLSAARICDTLINKPSCLFPNRMRIVPGHPEESFFLNKLTGEGLDDAPTGGECSSNTNLLMPYGAAALQDDELALVHNWIAAGAECKGSGDPVDPGPGGLAIASFTADFTAPSAGDSFMFTVTLDRPAPEGGQKIYFEKDIADALSMPLQVTVPATQTSWRVEGLAMAPTSRFTIRARTTPGGASKDLVVRIAGLEIAEVLADPPGNDDGYQWIKIRNRTAQSIDLSTYELKAGQTSYGLVTVPLSGTIAAGGCAVIGGPKQELTNGDPLFSQVVDFEPDLPHTGLQAVGFAIFDRNGASVGGSRTPVDTMLVGSNNNAHLPGADGDFPNPTCARPSTGMSTLRTGPGTCVESVMRPRSCD
jgi:hypothetical protein